MNTYSLSTKRGTYVFNPSPSLLSRNSFSFFGKVRINVFVTVIWQSYISFEMEETEIGLSQTALLVGFEFLLHAMNMLFINGFIKTQRGCWPKKV